MTKGIYVCCPFLIRNDGEVRATKQYVHRIKRKGYGVRVLWGYKYDPIG